LIDRLEDPSTYEYVALNSGETLREGIGLILRAATPAALGILFSLALVFTSGQMGAAVVREKDQRAMEIVITSLRPYELVTGKVLGMTLLSLTQLGIWALGIGITLVLLLTSSGSFQLVAIPWKVFFWAIMLGIPAYFLYAFLAAGLGIIAGDAQQAQQLAGILGFLGMAPLWLLGVLIQSPNSPVMISLSLFPLTGPIFILLRMTIVEVPIWQLLASAAILIISLVATIWAITRIFRAAMLMYGQTLKPRQIIRALRGA
jgi:ABC-2 type transport system permease protein